MVKPIKPCDVVSCDVVSQESEPEIPEFVVTVFNNLIRRKWDGNSAVIAEDDAIKEIAKRMPDYFDGSDINFDGSDIFSSFGKWRIWRLTIEDLYTKAGWEVYNEYHVYRAGNRFDSRICYRFRKPSSTALNS